MLGITIGIVYIALGLFATLSGYKILKPFKNDDKKKQNIDKYQFYYRYGGILIAAYGIFKLIS